MKIAVLSYLFHLAKNYKSLDIVQKEGGSGKAKNFVEFKYEHVHVWEEGRGGGEVLVQIVVYKKNIFYIPEQLCFKLIYKLQNV